MILPANEPEKPHPSEITGRTLAVFVYDKTGTCGGSSILWGTAHFEDGKFSLRRVQNDPAVMPIPESAWHRLARNQRRDVEEYFGDADYYIMLLAGPKPDRADSPEWKDLDIAVPKKKED